MPDRSDVLTPLQRHKCMSRVKGQNTGPEMLLRKALWHRGYRYRLNSKLPGRPDIVFQKRKIAIFVDGCFWHGCAEHKNIPQTNKGFWEKKIKGNIQRDRKVTAMLTEMEWTVLRFWEHDIVKNLDSVIEVIQKEFHGK